MEHSEQMNELAAAMVAAQANIENAARDRKGNYGTYATLASVIDACKHHLNAAGISFAQMYEPSETGTLKLTTTLVHTSGQFISGTMTVPLPKPDPQGFGSASTYARRYALAAMVGVAPEDDDGEGAKRPQQRQQAQPRAETRPAAPDPLADDERFTLALDKAFSDRGFQPSEADKAVTAACNGYKVGNVEALDLKQRRQFIAAIAAGKVDKYKAKQPA